MILNRLQQSLQPNRSHMKCDIWKPCRDQRWQIELRFSIWRFSEQFFFVNNHLQCYWPIINNSISKICPNFKFLVLTFSRPMSCSMINEQKLCEVKIFQLQSMSNAIRYINQRFAFMNSGFSCLALIFNLSYLRSTILHAKKRLQVAKHFKWYDESYTLFFSRLTRTNGWVVKASRRESGDLGSISIECWNSLPPLGHFAWHWARQCTDTRTFYIAALTIIFSFLDFLSGDLALTGF